LGSRYAAFGLLRRQPPLQTALPNNAQEDQTPVRDRAYFI
jgi:hypothetical protein